MEWWRVIEAVPIQYLSAAIFLVGALQLMVMLMVMRRDKDKRK